MSYALQQRVFATGHQAVTIAAGAAAGAVTVSVAGINKLYDSILITFDLNFQSDIQQSGSIYVYAVTDAASFTVDASMIENIGASPATVFINWAVLR